MKIEDIKVGNVYFSNDDQTNVTVSGVGDETVLGYADHRREEVWDAADLSEVKTYPELWLNVYCEGRVDHAMAHASLSGAIVMTTEDVIARIHLAADGTLTLEDL